MRILSCVAIVAISATGVLTWPQPALAFASPLPLHPRASSLLSRTSALRMQGGSVQQDDSTPEEWQSYVSAGPSSLVSRRPTMAEANLPDREWSMGRLEAFECRDYKSPWYLRNRHVNTIVGALLATPQLPPYRRERFDTSDGDFFCVDFLDSRDKRRKPRGLVFLYHGLEATTLSPLCVREAWSLAEAGFDVAAMSFRGCSGEDNLRPGAYHLGFTDDVKFLAKTLHKRDPERRMYVTGTSLGGNVMTKLLGELGDDAVNYGILGGAVACVPLSDNSAIDGNDFNRKVYSGNFLKSLKPKAERQHRKFPEAFDIEKVRNASSMGDFDDAYIAAIYGYKDKFDYYDKNICISFLKDIRVPLLMVNARDDPFFDPEKLPSPKDVKDGTVRLVETARGGHCGYLEGIRSLSLGSLDAIAAKIFLGRRTETKGGTAPNGWLPDELARFLVFIDDAYQSREFGRKEQIRTLFEAEEELREKVGELEQQARRMRKEGDKLIADKEGLLKSQERSVQRQQARDMLMASLEGIYAEAEEKAARQIEQAFGDFDAQNLISSCEVDSKAMSILPTGGGRGEGGGQRNGVLSRIIAEALLTKTSSMKQPSSEDSDGAPGDKAVAAAILARMDALRACVERLESSAGPRGVDAATLTGAVVKELLNDTQDVSALGPGASLSTASAEQK